MVSNTKSIIPTCQEVNQFHSMPWSGPFQKKDIDTISECATVVKSLANCEKILFELLHATALNGRGCWQSHYYLAKRVGCSVDWIKKCLKRLRDKGLIFWAHREYSTNIYFVALATLQNEFIRQIKDKFLHAQLAWFRRLIASGVFMTMLQTHDLEAQSLQRNSNLVLKKQSNSKAERVHDMRARGAYVRGTKKQECVKVNVQKEVFESLKAKGFVFSNGSRVDLQIFQADVVLAAAARFAVRAQSTQIQDNWRFFLKLCHEISKEGSYTKNIAAASALALQYGIDENAERKLEYTPASDNARKTSPKRENRPYPHFKSNHEDYDGNFLKYARNPIPLNEEPMRVRLGRVDTPEESMEWLTEKVGTGEFDSYFEDKSLADKTAKALAASAAARARGDEGEAARIMFQHLHDVSRKRVNLNTEQSKADYSTNTPGNV